LRVKDFKQRQQNYISDSQKIKSDNQEAKNYSFVGIPAIRKPQISSIYNEGETHSFGNFIKVKIFIPIYSAINNSTSENDVYEFPTRVDITYLITFFLSLFVLIISFDSINGEKELGTLRMIFVYPIKRFQFIAKKIIGTISFVGLVFGIPYFGSIAYLLIAFPSEINFPVMEFFIIYFIYAIMYLLVITLIGILFSVLTKSSGKSLIFSLLFWITFSIIIPITYNYFSRYLINQNKLIDIVEQQTKIRSKRNRNLLEIPDDINPNKYGHQNWNGGHLSELTVFGRKEMYEAHINYLKYYHKNYMPEVRKDEDLQIEKLKLINRPEKLSKIYLFFNPNVLFEQSAEALSLTGVDDYLNYLQTAISLRTKYTNQGIKDGWLFSKKYISLYEEDAESYDFDTWILSDVSAKVLKREIPGCKTDKKGRMAILKNLAKYYNSNIEPPKYVQNLYKLFQYKDFNSRNKWKKFTFKLPKLPEFHQSKLDINLIIKRTLPNFVLLTILIISLLITIDIKFKKFDLR
jgi:ABC-type transport system involved in multi-copper enzyme maturation permease subunit